MTTQIIILLADSKLRLTHAAFASANSSLMEACLFSECSRLPPLHSRSGHRHPVYAAFFNRSVSPNVFKTLTPEELACSGYVINADEVVIVLESVLNKGGSSHTEVWRLFKPVEQERKVIGFE